MNSFGEGIVLLVHCSSTLIAVGSLTAGIHGVGVPSPVIRSCAALMAFQSQLMDCWHHDSIIVLHPYLAIALVARPIEAWLQSQGSRLTQEEPCRREALSQTHLNPRKSKMEQKNEGMLPGLLLHTLAMSYKDSEEEGAVPCRHGTRWMGTSLL